jgi:hypothetical protein
MKIIFPLFLSFLLFIVPGYSQKGSTTVGIQIKPIFPFSFLGTGKISNDINQVHIETLLNSGFSAGLVVRHNFTNLLAFETGINYVKRKYSLKIKDGNFENTSYFRVISYEIPMVLMVYAQLGEKIYINGSMGPTIDMFASSIQTFNEYYNQVAFRNHIIQPAVSANIGFEFRTEKSGTIYLGSSFQRPFSFIYLSKVAYYQKPDDLIVYNELVTTKNVE